MNWTEVEALGVFGTFSLMLLGSVVGWIWKVHSGQARQQTEFENEIGRLDEQHKTLAARLATQETLTASNITEIRSVRESQIRIEENLKHMATTMDRMAGKLGVLQ